MGLVEHPSGRQLTHGRLLVQCAFNSISNRAYTFFPFLGKKENGWGSDGNQPCNKDKPASRQSKLQIGN
jgi:hypothetical protein